MSFVYKKVKRKRAGTGVDLASQSLMLLTNLEIAGLRNEWEKRDSKLLSEFIEEYENNWIEAIIYAATVSLQDDQKMNVVQSSFSTSASGSQDTEKSLSRNVSKSVPDMNNKLEGLKQSKAKTKSSINLMRVKIPSAINLLLKSPSNPGMPGSPSLSNPKSANSSNNAPTSPRLQMVKSLDSKINGTSSTDSYKGSDHSLPSGTPKLSILTNIITNFSKKAPMSPRLREFQSPTSASKYTPYPTSDTFQLPFPTSPTNPTPEISIELLSMNDKENSGESTDFTGIKQETSLLSSPVPRKEEINSPLSPSSQISSSLKSIPTSPTAPKMTLAPRSAVAKSDTDVSNDEQDGMTLLQFLKISQTSLENLEPVPVVRPTKEKRPSLRDIFKRRTSALIPNFKYKRRATSASPLNSPVSPTPMIPRAILKIPKDGVMYVDAELMDRIKSPTMYTCPKIEQSGNGQNQHQPRTVRRVLFAEERIDIIEEMKKREAIIKSLNPSITKKITGALRSIIRI